jgi:response regulator RpfG family c-di-GMP phosphodiesterase
MTTDIEKNIEGESLSALKKAEPWDYFSQLDAIFSVYPDIYFQLDLDGKILDYRIGNLAALYLPPEKIPGSLIQDVFPVEVGKKFLDAIRQVLQHQKVGVVDFRIKISDKERCFEARLVPLAESQIVVIIREVTEREEATARIQRQVKQLSALHTIDSAISASFDIRIPLSVILQQTISQLGVDAVNVRLLNPLTHMLEFAAGQGFRTNSLQNTSIMVGQGFAGEAVLKRRIIRVENLKRRSTGPLQSPRFLEEDFTSYFAVPLIARGDVKGVLEIYQRSPMNPKEDWLEFLNMLASQAAVAIESAILFQNFQRTNTELTLAYDAVIESWSQALELSGRESKKHTFRVVNLATELAGHMGVEEKEILQLQRGAKLHDIGKICIPETILQKAEPLTNEEWKVVRQHPLLAYQLLSPIKYLASALDIPHYHHEKWDGSGYPDGLKSEEIPIAARLFSLVHKYDSLTTSHPYRSACSKEQALEHIKDQAGKQFDPVIVKVFLKMMETKSDTDQ